MDIEILTEATTQIVTGKILYSWRFFGVLTLLVFLVGCASTFLASYFIQKGKGYATKNDVSNILEQIKKTTSLTEKIKAEVSEKFSYKEKLREKMEEVFWESYEYESGLKNEFFKILDGKNMYSDATTSLSKIEMLISIYFPTVNKQLIVLQEASVAITALTTNLRTKSKDFDSSKYMIAVNDIKLASVNLRVSLLDKYKNELCL
ncbi:MAG: hypothetical protein ACI86C_001964 [Candidatus Latescibacterota bacterium]|jgi:hypothetical protein